MINKLKEVYFKYSLAIIVCVVLLVVMMPALVLFLPAEFLILMAIPLFLVFMSVIVFGFKGIFGIPPSAPHYKIMRILILATPVVGVISGPIAYNTNSKDPVYLVIYPIMVTLLLGTALGIVSKILTKRFKKGSLEQTKTDVYEPVQGAAQNVLSDLTAEPSEVPLQQEPVIVAELPQDVYPTPKTMPAESVVPASSQETTAEVSGGVPGIIKIIGIAILLIIGAIILSVIVRNVGVNSERAELERLYASKLEECGKKPIVIVSHDGFGSSYTEAYEPSRPLYENKIYTVDFYRSEKVLGYYCTKTEALKTYGSVRNLD